VDWLPEIIPFDGNWEEYEDSLYQSYSRLYQNDDLYYSGQKVREKYDPAINKKSCTFWHIISEGEEESERTPNFERCARIAWPRAIIQNCDDPAVSVWVEPRSGGKGDRVHFWIEEHDYLVVLAKRNSGYLLWTAFCITYESNRKGLASRRNRYQKS
jgi:hypothetical protein